MEKRWEDRIWLALLPIYIVLMGLLSGFTIWVMVEEGYPSLILSLFFGITLAGMAVFSEKKIETALWVVLGILLGILALGILELERSSAIQSGILVFLFVGAAIGAFFTPMIITNIRERELSAGLGCPLAVISGAVLGALIGIAAGIAFGWFAGTINPLHEMLYLDSPFPPGLVNCWGWLSRIPIGSFLVLSILGILHRHKGLTTLVLGTLTGLGMHGILPLASAGSEAYFWVWAWAAASALMWLLITIVRKAIPEIRDWLNGYQG